MEKIINLAEIKKKNDNYDKAMTLLINLSDVLLLKSAMIYDLRDTLEDDNQDDPTLEEIIYNAQKFLLVNDNFVNDYVEKTLNEIEIPLSKDEKEEIKSFDEWVDSEKWIKDY